MSIKTFLLTISGFLLLGLGAIGAFVPVLPTTPFVLVASACFAGNPALRSRMLRVRFFREHLENYQQRTGLQKKTLVKSLSVLWVMLCISMIVVAKLWCTLLLLFVGGAVTVHLLCMARPKRARAREGTEGTGVRGI